MNYINQQSKTTNLSSSIGFNEVLSAKATDNTDTTVPSVDAYTEYLRTKYGGNIMIQNVGKDQNSLDALGASTSGTGNVVIASNILETMANDPEKAAYYEKKIQYFFDSVPRYQAELSAMGHEIHSCGIIIHPDGTVTHYISGDLKPEVRAKIEAQIKAEREEKAKRRQDYLERSQEAAEERRQMASDPQARQHYEKKIQGHFDTIPKANAFMAMHGRRVVSSGVIIHPNGEVTYYSSSDYTPEEKARLEKAMKEEDEAKAKKRAEQKRLNEIATDRYLQLMSSTVPEIGLLSSNIFEQYFSTIPSNIDTNIFATSTHRPIRLK